AERAAEAELVLHAGDISGAPALEWLAALGPPLCAVRGNVDEPGVAARLPERLAVELRGVVVGLVHDAGPAHGRLERLRGWFPAAAAVVFGHSHVPLHEVAQDGFQIFNPGSATTRRREPRCTIGLATAGDGRIAFRHLEVPCSARAG
ncbi:MAG TPA: metallophosphoesterase family protein, partial [Gaiellaceae bacterium]|nr:metallophosphoesterase family protein [Gaiellaceae bacterium]